MPLVKLPYFGVVDPNSLGENYDTEADFSNTKIQVDLNFEGKSIEPARLETVKHFLENIRIHDLNNKKYIQDDFNNEDGDTVREYLEHHIDELPTDDLHRLIGSNAKAAEQTKLLLKKLHLVRVGLYPEGENQFAVFDYSLGRELTNYLVVVNTDENGNLDYLTMES